MNRREILIMPENQPRKFCEETPTVTHARNSASLPFHCSSFLIQSCFLAFITLQSILPDIKADSRPATIIGQWETGKVMSLARAFETLKLTTDLPPFESPLALVTESGEILPLLSDEGGRIFYLDPTMQNRQVRLKLQASKNHPFQSVINVEIELDGRWRIPQYYCDVCTIAVRFPQTCLCCQGPMEFRVKPER